MAEATDPDAPSYMMLQGQHQTYQVHLPSGTAHTETTTTHEGGVLVICAMSFSGFSI